MADCLIVNYDRCFSKQEGQLEIMSHGKPKVIYDDLSVAEEELIRLATKNREEEFVLFKAVASVEYRDGQVFIKELED